MFWSRCPPAQMRMRSRVVMQESCGGKLPFACSRSSPSMAPATDHHGTSARCAKSSRVLFPRSHGWKRSLSRAAPASLAMATLGGDPGPASGPACQRRRRPGEPGQRVALRRGRCPGRHLRAMRQWPWTRAPAPRRKGRITIKQVHGQHAHRKAHLHHGGALLALAESLRWPKFVQHAAELRIEKAAHDHDHDEHGDGHGHDHAPDEWKTLAMQAAGCLLAGVGRTRGRTHFGAPWATDARLLAGGLRRSVPGSRRGDFRAKSAPGEIGRAFPDARRRHVGAAAIGAWHEGALLLLLFSSVGRDGTLTPMGRTQREIGALLARRAQDRHGPRCRRARERTRPSISCVPA